MQRNRRGRGSYMRHFGWTHDKDDFFSRRAAMRRDYLQVKTDSAEADEFVSPFPVIAAVQKSRDPRRPWTSGQPIIRPATGLVEKMVKPKRWSQPSSTYADMMTDRGSACG